MQQIQKKICLLGDFAVGKTSLVRRYVEGRFDDRYLSTIGVKISRKHIATDNYELNLIIWDLAGGEEFAGHDRNYLRGAAGALLVCDLTRPDTFALLVKYAQQLYENNPGAVLAVAANKSDLVDENAADLSELEAVCGRIKCRYLLTSAKTGANVEYTMVVLANALVSRSDSVVP